MNTVYFENCRTLNLPNDFRFPSLFLGDVNLSEFRPYTYYWLVEVDDDFCMKSPIKRQIYMKNIVQGICADLKADEQIGLVEMSRKFFKSDAAKDGYLLLGRAALFIFDVIDKNFWENWPDVSSRLLHRHIDWLLYHPFASYPNSMVGMTWSLF